MSIKSAIESLLAFSDDYHFVIAYSGGVDSHVLLHALLSQRTSFSSVCGSLRVTVVHVNHQLNPKSDVWAAHCQTVCNHLNVPLHIETIQIALQAGDSLEEKAREGRYAVLKKYSDKNSVLVTAHNLNDQAETFLFQALRGAGTKGLSAMPVKKAFGEGFLLRPLLATSREDIEQYARDHHLCWIEDDSNLDTKFNRNFLRHDIFPVLKTRFPKCRENFARTARLMAEQEAILSDIAALDYQTIKKETGFDETYLSVALLRQFSEPRQRLILREWFYRNNLRMPNEKHLKQIQKDVLNASQDAHPKFILAGIMLLRERGFLRLMRKVSVSTAY